MTEQIFADIEWLQRTTAELVQRAMPVLQKIGKPLSVFTYLVLPFLYSFTDAPRLFRGIVYPVVYVVPWVMILVQRDPQSVHMAQMFAPFAGLIFWLICVHDFRRSCKKVKSTVVGEMFRVAEFCILAVAAAATPMVPFAPQFGIAIQFSWPFMKAKVAFGVEFYRHFSFKRIGEFLVGAIGIPLMGHAWIWPIGCAMLHLIRIVVKSSREGRKTAA